MAASHCSTAAVVMIVSLLMAVALSGADLRPVVRPRVAALSGADDVRRTGGDTKLTVRPDELGPGYVAAVVALDDKLVRLDCNDGDDTDCNDGSGDDDNNESGDDSSGYHGDDEGDDRGSGGSGDDDSRYGGGRDSGYGCSGDDDGGYGGLTNPGDSTGNDGSGESGGSSNNDGSGESGGSSNNDGSGTSEGSSDNDSDRSGGSGGSSDNDGLDADSPPAPATTAGTESELGQELCSDCEEPKEAEPKCNTCGEEPKPKEAEMICIKVHAVRESESCDSVGQWAGLSQDDFLRFNPNLCCEKIFVGQWVCLDATCAD